MNIYHLEDSSFIYGPGCRYVIWVQGCSIRCKGCWNKEMWPFDIVNDIPVNEMVSFILKEKDIIEGVTILGGEPFDQFDELLELTKQIKKMDLSIIVYTGYEKKELVQKHYLDILNYIDVLISGRFIEHQKTLQTGLTGSSNQLIECISDKYTNDCFVTSNEVEISILETGAIDIYGYL
jgi:anaerobic ribonucleoside-triphosphate reductase activating protein